METKDADNFKALMATVADLYGKEISAPTLKIWWHTLKRFDFETVNNAVMGYIADPNVGSWLPKPADIVGRIEGNAEQIKVLTQNNANYYWGVIQSNLHKAGKPDFDDPDVDIAINQIGGWRSLAMEKMDNLVFRSRAFISAYTTIKESAKITQSNPQLGVMNKVEAQKSLTAIYHRLGEKNEE